MRSPPDEPDAAPPEETDDIESELSDAECLEAKSPKSPKSLERLAGLRNRQTSPKPSSSRPRNPWSLRRTSHAAKLARPAARSLAQV